MKVKTLIEKFEEVSDAGDKVLIPCGAIGSVIDEIVPGLFGIWFAPDQQRGRFVIDGIILYNERQLEFFVSDELRDELNDELAEAKKQLQLAYIIIDGLTDYTWAVMLGDCPLCQGILFSHTDDCPHENGIFWMNANSQLGELEDKT